MSETTPTGNPGSHTATRQGCTCSGTRNQFGRGAFVSGGDVQYDINPKCPLHGRDA